MMEEKFAKINAVMLGFEDHGIFGFNIDLQFSQSGFQGTGWWSFTTPTVLKEILNVCGEDRWDKLKGHHIIALYEDSHVVGLKSLPTDGDRQVIFRDVVSA